MRPQEEAPLAGVVEAGEVAHDVDEIRVGLVVVSPDAGGAVVIAELEQQRREVVGEVPVDHAGGEKRVPHRHVREEQRRGHDQGTNGEQRLEQSRVVEQSVRPLLQQEALVVLAPAHISPGEGGGDHPEILRPQATANVGQDHARASF